MDPAPDGPQSDVGPVFTSRSPSGHVDGGKKGGLVCHHGTCQLMIQQEADMAAHPRDILKALLAPTHRPARLAAAGALALAATVPAVASIPDTAAHASVGTSAQTSPQRGPGATPDFTLLRGGPAYTTSFTTSGGEGLLNLTVWAPGVSWQRVGAESAIASAYVDGTYETDILVTGDTPVGRQFQIGGVTAGTHQLKLVFADDRSPAAAHDIDVAGLSVQTVSSQDPSYVALTHSPILYGRSLPAYGGPFQNAWTDPPLVAWHYSYPQPDGTTKYEYQIVWSNEDGGTVTEPPAEQARWGRMTDIEWIYRVTVDANGNTVAGSETFQAPSHQTSTFAGAHEGGHPVLQTCTDNNNVCDQPVDAKMRFYLSTAQTMDPTTQAREQIMEMNPWMYAVMGEELIREGRTESHPNTDSAQLSDARNYLYIVINKTTNPYSDSTPWVGTSIGVKLKGDRNLYRSDHNVPNWSLQRDGEDATTVELPSGTKMSDIEEIDAIRFSTSERSDRGSGVTVQNIRRAYLLDHDYLPVQPFIAWSGNVTLTQHNPVAALWRQH